jgi:hypothetical protein
MERSFALSFPKTWLKDRHSEPIRQGEQIARCGLEGTHLADDFARCHSAVAGNNTILVNIKARAVGLENVHENFPLRRRPGTSVKRTLENMLPGQRGPWQNMGCSKVLDPTRQRALTHEDNTDLSASGAG